MTLSFIKMDFAAVCRTCLNNNRLYPIFTSEENHERFSRALYLCTGIQINLNDGLPQNICIACMNQVNSMLKFRKKCREVETQLYNIKSEVPDQNNTIETKYSPNDILHENCSNITEFKEEFNIIDNIKTEPSEIDFDEDQPLKLFTHTSNNILPKSNEYKNIPTKTENIDKIDVEFINIELEANYLKEDKSSKDFGPACDDVEDNIPITILSQSSQKTDVNDTAVCKKDQLLSTTESTFKETSCKESNVPYIVTESVAKTKRVVCKICQKELSIRSIDTHMAKRHPGADERKVKCELCDKYVMKEKMNRHRLMAHGSTEFNCGYCKSEFNTKELLVDHGATCTAKKRKRRANDAGRTMAECDVCHKKMQRASLKMHKAVKHAGLRPVCEHCGKSFGNKFRLNEHYRAKHGYEKFQCTSCDFRSASIMAMKNHERRHRGEKPFVCESCGAKFHAAYLLAQHKHSHRTEKLVKCDLCPASFKTNNSLHMHKLTCHSKSLYRCTICSRSYKCRYYAVKHARVAHGATGTPPVIKLMT